MIKIECDGTCKDGNGAWAFVVFVDDILMTKIADHSDIKTTHNRMEYTSIQKALEYALEIFPDEEVLFYTDSKLVVDQLSLQSQVGKTLAPYWKRCMDIIDERRQYFKVVHGSRDEVKHAHALASTVRNFHFG